MENKSEFLNGPWTAKWSSTTYLIEPVSKKNKWDGIALCPEKDFAQAITATPDLIDAALDFVNKVDTGRAKSTDSYNKFKAALKKAGILK